MSENKTTLFSYEKNLQAYIDITPSKVDGTFKQIIDYVLELIPKDSLVLELGSGTGRDADYIESKGYDVTRTDAADSFIGFQKSLGKNITKLNLLDFNLGDKYDLIFANAVLLHFTEKQFVSIIMRLKSNITSDGYFVFSLKQGEGEIWSSHKLGSDRYYKLWKRKEVENILTSMGFDILKVFEVQNKKWLFFITQVK